MWALERDSAPSSIVAHSDGLHAPINPLRWPPAVGGCRAHAWGGSAGKRKPSRPAGAAERATDGAVIDAVVRHKFVGCGTVGIEVLRLCP